MEKTKKVQLRNSCNSYQKQTQFLAKISGQSCSVCQAVADKIIHNIAIK